MTESGTGRREMSILGELRHISMQTFPELIVFCIHGRSRPGTFQDPPIFSHLASRMDSMCPMS